MRHVGATDPPEDRQILARRELTVEPAPDQLHLGRAVTTLGQNPRAFSRDQRRRQHRVSTSTSRDTRRGYLRAYSRATWPPKVAEDGHRSKPRYSRRASASAVRFSASSWTPRVAQSSARCTGGREDHGALVGQPAEGTHRPQVGTRPAVHEDDRVAAPYDVDIERHIAKRYVPRPFSGVMSPDGTAESSFSGSCEQIGRGSFWPGGRCLP